MGDRQALANKKGETELLPSPLIGIKKGKSIPISNRMLLPVTVLGDYREKGKTYPTSNEAFSNLLDRSLSEKGKAYPISNRAIITLLLSSTPARCLSIARNSLALLIVWTSPLARELVH